MSYPPAGPGPDPYRFGPPPQQVPVANQHPTGRQILGASWRLLKQDRELIALPVLGTIFGFLAFAVLFAPGLLIGLSSDGDARVPMYVFAFLGALASSMITIFFQAALVVGVYQRADGQDPTIRSTIDGAWRLKRQILGWALLTTVVGTIIRAVEERFGFLGKLVGFLGGVAWAVASFFVVPVIVADGLGPIEAVKRSIATIRQMWGTSVRTTLRFGFLQFALMIVPIALVIVGFVLIGAAAGSGGAGAAVGGVALLVVGAVTLIGMGIVFAAISMYARSLIYRWATGRPVPGIDPTLFAGAFTAKKRR